MSTAKLKKDVLKQLHVQPLSLAEIAAAMGLKEKRVFRLLRSLFEAKEITSLRGSDGIRRYCQTTEDEKAAAKAALTAAAEGEEVAENEEDE